MTPTRVLVVDDDIATSPIVRRELEREGFVVVEAGTGAEALALAAEASVDVAVLDLNLPDMTGLEVLGELRKRSPDLYVIMLTGAGSESDRVRGLVSGGADDYIVKPFSAPELAARVVALDRRRAAKAATAIEFGELRIELGSRQVLLAGQVVELARREFDLLAYLAAHPGTIFTRGHLLQAVWASSAEWQQETTVTEHIRRIRAKLELDPANPRWVVTVRGSGYRFAPTAHTSAPELMSGADSSRNATIVLTGTTIKFASPAVLAMLGLADVDQVVNRDVVDFVAPRSRAAAAARAESVKSGRWPRPEVITLLRADGSESTVELASVPVLWERETASQVTLWELAGDTSRVRELATGIRTDVPDAVIVTTAELRIQSFNAAAEELYGWREREVIGRSLDEVVPRLCDDDELQRTRSEVLGAGRWHGETMQRRRDGTSVRVRCSLTLLRDGAANPVGYISVNRLADDLGDSIDTASAIDEALDAEIRRGVDNDEFTVLYQPIVDLGDRRPSGVEALVRWVHPERGVLEPGSFIATAERSGAIVPLGEVVLAAACRQAQAWRRAGHDLDVAVNLSARQLADEDLPGRLSDLMATTSMPRGKLWLEVTETSLVEDLDRATAILHEIDEIGACVAIDDFGTGWASLTYLRQFPVHEVKIDRSFVAGLGGCARDAAIVSSMISLGHELDVRVVAEGIETMAQHRALHDLGCELGQGYLFGRPQPPEKLDLGRW